MHSRKSERAHPLAIIFLGNNIANNEIVMMMPKDMITKRNETIILRVSFICFNKTVYRGSIFRSKVIGLFELH